MPGDAARRPRILVTGFSVFPGAPVNPTEALVSAIEAGKGEFAGRADIATAVFEVSYERLPDALARTCAEASPDIAVHFGLAQGCRGFRLERTARNGMLAGRPDNRGFVPASQRICDLDETYSSTLPLGEIHEALAARGLPVEYSDDAGGYLCNYLFYHSRAGLCAGFRPAMSGFVHVPLCEPTPESPGLDRDRLVAGGLVIVEACLASFLQDEENARHDMPGTV